MSLRCNRCDAVDAAETAQKKKECESPKSSLKEVFTLKHRLPVDMDSLGENQQDSTETCRVGDPTKQTTGWCQPPAMRPCPRMGQGQGQGQGSSLAARWVNRHTAHQTHCHPKQCCGRSSLKQADFFNQVVCVTFDSGVLLLPRHTSSATPSIYCQLELDWKTSGTRTPSSALSCVVKANLTPVKTKFYN